MCTIVLSSGTSVPDSLSSIVVARKGEGDMAIAIANVLGVQRADPPCLGHKSTTHNAPSPPPSPQKKGRSIEDLQIFKRKSGCFLPFFESEIDW